MAAVGGNHQIVAGALELGGENVKTVRNLKRGSIRPRQDGGAVCLGDRI
jgi:hypothetical protein